MEIAREIHTRDDGAAQRVEEGDKVRSLAYG